jgi:hypothetical protein
LIQGEGNLALRKEQAIKRKRHTEEQIIAILKEHEAGMRTADLCRKHGISKAMIRGLNAGTVCA